MGSIKNYGQWLQHDGKTVKIDGLAYRLQCKTVRTVYPYPDEKVDVIAVPVNKNSKHYKDTKNHLNDDWVTDILDSSIEVQSCVWQQLN